MNEKDLTLFLQQQFFLSRIDDFTGDVNKDVLGEIEEKEQEIEDSVATYFEIKKK